MKCIQDVNSLKAKKNVNFMCVLDAVLIYNVVVL